MSSTSCHDKVKIEIKYNMYIRIESGWDDPDNLGHMGHFLVGQVDPSTH